MIKNLCVYCGSGNRIRRIYVEQAVHLARAMVKHGQTLVFGGGVNGLMGVLADAFIEAGGKPIGVIPKSLYDLGLHHKRVQDLLVVQTLHERKQLMISLSDGFVALPGGLGTLEEFIEALSWAQLGIHSKPCGLLNTDGYFDAFIAFLDTGVREGFVRVPTQELFISESEPDELLRLLMLHQPLSVDLRTEAQKAGPPPSLA